MSRQEEAARAALAAQAAGREVGSYEVVGKPLTHNGKSHKPGATISLSKADGDILARHGRVAAQLPKRGKPAGNESA